MCEEDRWHVPEDVLRRWAQEDQRLAREAYGDSRIAKPHEFPCLGEATQARKGTCCVMLVLGVVRNKQATMVINGPNGSDLPNGKRGEAMTIGHVYTALSSAVTRAVGNSNANGWTTRVHNCIEMELRMIRPVENGPGVAGVTARRLRWLLALCEDMEAEAAKQPENVALKALATTVGQARAAGESEPRPEGYSEQEFLGLRIWKGLHALAIPNRDEGVRERTRTFPRQVKRTDRKRLKRLAVGTTIAPTTKVLSYAKAVRVDPATGHISVMALADAGRRLKIWVPWTTVCETYREQLLTSCMRDVLGAISS